MLLLEVPLPDRPDAEAEGRPALEIDVRRDDGPEVSASVGDGGKAAAAAAAAARVLGAVGLT